VKQAIAINLKDLEQLLKQYVAAKLAGDEFLLQQMQLGHFLLWATKQQREMKGDDSHGQQTKVQPMRQPRA